MKLFRMHTNPKGIVPPSPRLRRRSYPGKIDRRIRNPVGDLCKSFERLGRRGTQKKMQPEKDKQASFFDLAVQQRGGANRVLETIAREVDFKPAEERVSATYGRGGRPACRVGMLLRVMILQHLYGLSDPQAEEQLKDRLSFQKFVQLGTEETVPDETTICRFRQRLIQCGLHEQLLQLLNTQLEARGYIVKQTTLVDATIIESSRKRPDPQAAKDGTAPDAQASYTRKNGCSYYGYKAHISSDGAHQLIRTALISTAKVQDCHVFEHVAPAESRQIYADKIYDTTANQAWLRERNIQSGILKKGARYIKLSEQDRQDNRAKGQIRQQVERIFAHFKRWQFYQRVRYLGLVKNQLELTLKAVAYNLKRLANILQRKSMSA